jgi:hypothetical protein
MRNKVTPLRRLRKRVLGISPAEASFARRGFRSSDPLARRHLEQIGYTFLQGYYAALEHDEPAELAIRLGAIEAGLRGFAFEGAAMGLALLDYLTPWNKRRVDTFLNGPGAEHLYMVHVGIGWALARLPGRIERALAGMDSLLRWLALDGYGFHAGYFEWHRYVEGRMLPRRLSGYAWRAFDQGLGRSLWFVEGADVNRIPATIVAFPPSRQGDLWSGVGLACAYAGGVERPALEALWEAAGHYRPDIAQGVAFAAKARELAGNPTAHTEMACLALCGMTAHAAASVTDSALRHLPPDHAIPAYEVWRQRIRAQFTKEVVRLWPE